MLFYHLNNLVYWIGKQWKTGMFYHIHHLLLIHWEDIQTLVFKCGARIVTFQVKGSQANIRFILDLQVYKSQVMQKLTCPLVSYLIGFHKCHKSKNKHQKTNFLYSDICPLWLPESISNFKYYESFESEKGVHDWLIT